MSNTSETRSEFIQKAEAIILENISNEQFGVSELAEVMNMSRSNLLRKIKKDTTLSASQFMRQVRLVKSMEMLKQNSMTVSEVSYKVGFGSTSYYIKCFREYYGYPPGEAGKRKVEDEPAKEKTNLFSKYRWLILGTASAILIVLSVFLFNNKKDTKPSEVEKSIAVLPFKNESNDSLNLYFVNGLMESSLNKLQKIEDLRVISRTSVEKYRETTMSIPEIAEELNVNYLVEGSGQRIGDQVLLNIQLIEASSDRPIWVEQYSREVGDVFALQNEVAKKIATAIKAMVTPAEMQQIEKIPTENLVAYDYYLQALDPYYSRSTEGLVMAIPLFKKAIENDDQFALAYAHTAIAYYFMDLNQADKQHTEDINNYSDKALLYDSKSAESLISKALYYMTIEDFRLALPYLKKALEYNPNSSPVIQMLADLYARAIPNTSKYLEYALKGIQLNIGANDSIAKSYVYLHLSNALIQTGFVDEAITYIDMSLDYNPNNYYSPLVKTYIMYAKNRDLEETKNRLIYEYSKDSTRLDILQEIGKAYYFQKEYDSAFTYYESFANARVKYGLDMYSHEDLKISWVYQKEGLDAQAKEFEKSYSEYCENDESIYKSASMASKYAFEGKNDEAIEQLKIFATQKDFQYWILVFMEIDPILEPLKSHPDFEEVMNQIEDQFWKDHTKLKASLEEKGLM
ncbi:helix-turn-helix domain-containing protein [Lutimonas halocynthiae]|uniref:helix-turn-helix domain-containing protein n=1 Tax=Lutimonas halocynthiae TaxID=1446477 RepID=UPI0025B4518F|nr:helix-turn-helix domain-containing protein [Lutimonas halocynthiae]MDN3641542.1 helix-turn-helix domain-containing protein [Lutimonas halocynthiae]